jgi:hypothetical protein
VDERSSAKVINKETFPVYGGKDLSRKAVHNWIEKFSRGRSKVADDARPGYSVEILIEATVQLVEELIQTDRRITTEGCSNPTRVFPWFSMQHNVRSFEISKLLARCIPREMKDREKIK